MKLQEFVDSTYALLEATEYAMASIGKDHEAAAFAALAIANEMASRQMAKAEAEGLE